MKNPTNLDEKRDFYNIRGEVFDRFCPECDFDVHTGCVQCVIGQFLDACTNIIDEESLTQEDYNYVQEM